MDSENGRLINGYYHMDQDGFNYGNYKTARDLINKALSLNSKINPYILIYIYSGYLYMEIRDCDSALNEIGVTLSNFVRIFLLADRKKIVPEKEFGAEQWGVIEDNYYLLNKEAVYCYYQQDNPEVSKNRFLFIEKEWNEKFKLAEMVRLWHDYQLTGDNANFTKYYKMSFVEAKNEIQSASIFSKKKIEETVESIRYNIAIALQQQNNIKEAAEYVKELLHGADYPFYWIDKMKTDRDYKELLSEEKVKQRKAINKH